MLIEQVCAACRISDFAHRQFSTSAQLADLRLADRASAGLVGHELGVNGDAMLNYRIGEECQPPRDLGVRLFRHEWAVVFSHYLPLTAAFVGRRELLASQPPQSAVCRIRRPVPAPARRSGGGLQRPCWRAVKLGEARAGAATALRLPRSLFAAPPGVCAQAHPEHPAQAGQIACSAQPPPVPRHLGQHLGRRGATAHIARFE